MLCTVSCRFRTSHSERRVLAAAFGSTLLALEVEHPVRCVFHTVFRNFRPGHSNKRLKETRTAFTGSRNLSRALGARVFRAPKARFSVCVCVCVFFPSILDIKFVGRTSRGHTGGRSHRIFNPPSFCGACLDFCREKDSAIPFPSSTVKSNFWHFLFVFVFFQFSFVTLHPFPAKIAGESIRDPSCRRW